MYKRWKIGTRFGLALLLLCSVLAGFLANPGVAQAANCSGQTWPSNGSLQTSNWPGSNQYTATFQFRLSADELCSLQQQEGDYLEIDFQLRNFDVPAEWEGYSVSGTNLPGALHDVAVSDSQYIANPAVTRIYTSQLQAGTTYYATLAWTANARYGMTPTITFVWTPSHWAYSDVPVESGACVYGGNIWPPENPLNPNEAWCINGNANAGVILFGDKTFSNGVPNGALPLDGFRWYDWSPGSSKVGASSGTTAFPPPTVTDYRADRTILHSPDGTLYVMAGGAKFYFGSMSQFSSLGYSTAGMVNLSSETLNTIPNVPRDGTILRSGGGQVYVVAGGAKFNFGTMAEYYGQGYTDAQMISVPQSPLDAIGDAPGNRPSDGVVLQHPDGRLFVMSGGVKFYFGSMAEFLSLGYATSSIQRVSGAALDAIPTASSTSPPRDRTILRSGGGQIYVVAGGAKFHFSSMTEFGALGYGAWINVPQGSLDAIGDAPGNVPRNGTVLKSGGGQVYVVAGGSKFYFGSMTEYHNQGYTDAQMINVPQGPLDLLGDAPENMPKNGTVVHRNDGSIFVITGGVRWAFGSMAQYYQLGYTDAQMVRVSWAPLDGIADASASHLPANGSLLQDSDATVWVMKDSVRRSFTGAQQVTNLGYSWSNLIRVPDSQLSSIPSGGNLP